MKPLAALLFFMLFPVAATPQQPPTTDDPNYRRPSTSSLPPFNLGYFEGTWTVDWDVPDSVFGEGGQITGTETYKCDAKGLSCESVVKEDTPGGPVTQQVRMRYNPSSSTISRDEKDSRGFSVHYVGHVSTDQGLYQIAWTADPFRYKGNRIALKSAASLSAPTAFRVRIQISVDGQPATNFGSPWWRIRANP